MDGDTLVVNAAYTEKGFLSVELTDANENVVPGYERSSCDTFTGDSTAHVVTWNGQTALPTRVLSSGAKFRFYSRFCDLYSFKVS